MATIAQSLANAANAQFSTGPRTPEGKAKSARNAEKHGLSTGVLVIDPAHRPAFDHLQAQLVEELQPAGALELDAVLQIRDAAWRLRRVRETIQSYFRFHEADPFVHPETEAAIVQLNRYRASAEMLLYRATAMLADLQTTRLGRLLHLAKSENEAIGPLAEPKSFASMIIEDVAMNRRQREEFDADHSISKIE